MDHDPITRLASRLLSPSRPGDSGRLKSSLLAADFPDVPLLFGVFAKAFTCLSVHVIITHRDLRFCLALGGPFTFSTNLCSFRLFTFSPYWELPPLPFG